MKKEIKLILAPIVFIAVAAIAYFSMNSNKDAISQAENNSTTSAQISRSSAFVKGPTEAKVEIIEFFDPECEGCRAFHPILMKIMDDFQGQVKLQARYMLFHGNSYEAALALEGAGAQGKYWEFYNFLLERQHHWGHQDGSVRHIFEMYAKELNLDIDKFNSSYEDISYKAVIAQDLNDGKALDVRGTPTFFINGVKLGRLSYNDMKTAVEEALKK